MTADIERRAAELAAALVRDELRGAPPYTTPHPAVMAVCRAVIVLARAIPDLLFAAVFVRALQLGPLRL